MKNQYNRAHPGQRCSLAAADSSITGQQSSNLHKGSFLRPLVIVSINIEGFSQAKETLLADLCKECKCDILLVQETHRGHNSHRPKIAGMKLVLERPHDKYGSAIFTRPNLTITSTSLTQRDDIEILSVRTPHFCTTSVYKPPNTNYTFEEPNNFNHQDINLIIGDYNCRSTSWGYPDTDTNGEKLETWAEIHDLQLIHSPKLPASFNSGRWKRGYNPDNIFVSSKIAGSCVKTIGKPIPCTQHRPVICTVNAMILPEEVPFKRRFNFQKADWERFSKELDAEVARIPPQPEMYEIFIKSVQRVSRSSIPRGCRTNYIPGLTDDSKHLMNRYKDLYKADPFADDTIQAGEELLQTISTNRKAKWISLVENLDMKLSSRQAWTLLKNLSGDPTKPKNFTAVTADQIAAQLVLNGKFKGRSTRERLERNPGCENNFLQNPFSVKELESVISSLKLNKAAGIDDLRVEQIKNFGQVTMQWLLDLMNCCVAKLHIPRLWRKSRVVALLKPGKEPNDPKNFRPVSLLCHCFKIFERLILNRINIIIEERLIPQQAGFRAGKSCCSQILNLTQHIEDGFEKGEITGAAFVDLTAAYDTINHRKLLKKIYQLTNDYQLTSLIGTLLQNRRFQVSLQGKKSRWRTQKNGLPQGSVLAPALFNIYTNDQPITEYSKHFIYADDTAVAAQGKTFEEVEGKLSSALDILGGYYKTNHLKPNPDKTQVCAFHLRNKEAQRKLDVTWQGKQLQHCPTPVYLGVTLDRTLSFKKHCHNTRLKVSARNNILRKLTGTTWGASPHVLRTSALALCVSVSEYASPVWSACAHTKQVDTAVNETIRILTGCMKPTPVDKLYPIAGIAPPTVRRAVAADAERTKQAHDPRHPLHHHQPVSCRLKSRKSFIARTRPLEGTSECNRITRWRSKLPPDIHASEELAPGNDLPYAVWKSLNRLRVGVPRCKTNMQKWGIISADGDVSCECGVKQDPAHLLVCPLLQHPCTQQDLIEANDKAIEVATYWKC